ncbi:facilitated trehalose transporter Tret1-2 homolog isoform X2 [Anabrus simplex]
MKKPQEKQRNVLWPQMLAAGLATTCAMCSGTVLGWTSPTLPVMEEPHLVVTHNYNSTNVTRTSMVSEAQASWIGSLVPLGALVGALPAGFIADGLGRKPLILFLGILFLLGWVLIILSHEVVVYIYAGRFIQGIAAGAITVAIPLYNEEITEPSIRGKVGVFFDLMINVGILWSYSLGVIIPYPNLSIASGCLPLLFFITFVWMPESPVHLVTKGRILQAESALKWLRSGGSSDWDIQPELTKLQTLVSQSKAERETQKKLSLKERFSELSWSSPKSKPIKIIFGLMILRPLSGINSITFYTVKIFQEAGSGLSPNVATIIIGCILVTSNYVSSKLVDRIGRRILFLCSGAGVTLCYVIMITYFELKDHDIDVSHVSWLPLVAIGIFVVSFCLGIGPLPWLLMAELLPIEHKKWASGMGVCITWSLSFLVTKFFGKMINELGGTVTYGTFCIFCALGTMYIALFVPETKGKTREELQKEMGMRTEMNTIAVA